MPSFALSAEITDTRDYGKIILTEAEQQEIYKLLDDTLVKRDAQIEKFKRFHQDIKYYHDRKKTALSLELVAPSIALVLSVYLAPAIAIWGEQLFLPDFAKRTDKRLARYNETRELYLAGNMPTAKMYKAQDALIKSLAKLFMDDPAVALDIIAEKRELFPVMIENNPKVIKMLRVFNTVVSQDLEIYSDFSIQKLASVNAKTYFERLAEYIGIKDKEEEIRNNSADIKRKELTRRIKDEAENSKTRRVVIKEIKKDEKSRQLLEKHIEEIEKAAGANEPFPLAEPR
jgi:hypothetical protein